MVNFVVVHRPGVDNSDTVPAWTQEISSNGESGAVNPVNVYNQGIDLFSQLQSNKRTLELGSDFEVVDGFTTFSKPESPGLLKSAVLGAGILLGFAYVLIILIELNKYLNRVEEEGFGN